MRWFICESLLVIQGLFAYQDLDAQVILSPEKEEALQEAIRQGTKVRPGILSNIPSSRICPGVPSVRDVDGNIYFTVLIGRQCWMTSNLKVTKYNDGTSIPLDASGASAGNVGNQTWSSRTIGARTIYSHSKSNLSTYGFLYNWYAAKGIATAGSTNYKNLCPGGWHVPTYADWTTLTDYLGGEYEAGGKMKSVGTSYWNSTNTSATNESGFTGLPGGNRNDVGKFDNLGLVGVWWSSSENSSTYAWNLYLYGNSGNVNRYYNDKGNGLSVRCLKD